MQQIVKLAWLSQKEMTSGQFGSIKYGQVKGKHILSSAEVEIKSINESLDDLDAVLVDIIDNYDIIAVDKDYPLEIKVKLLNLANLKQKPVIVSLDTVTGFWKRITRIDTQIYLEDFEAK